MSKKVAAFGQCKQTVTPPYMGGFYHHRCSRRAVSDRGYCLVHDPNTITKKQEARHAKWVEEQKASVVGWHAKEMKEALEAIARGDVEDPARRAKAVLRELKKRQDEIG